jgi:peptidyl-prolyl cis-trans isomerase D
MLTTLRGRGSQKFMLVVLAIALLAIVVTGFGTGGGGLGDISGGGVSADSIAEVHGEPITSTEVTDQVNRQLSRAREQQPTLDLPTFFQGGAFEEIIRQLIAQRAIVAFGEANGFVISKRLIDGEIARIPAFRNLAGQFDETAFRTALQRERISEQQLRTDIAAELMQRQILVPITATAKVPQAMALQYASLLLEQRSGTVGLVPSAVMAAAGEPSTQEIAAFYRDNQVRYMIPERRVLRYALFGPEKVAAAATPTEAEIAAAYRANAARYAPSETRTLSQVILPSRQAAQALAAKVAGGTAFAQAAQQAGFSAGDIAIGAQSRAQYASLTSAAAANAVFGAAQGATVGPIQTPLGWALVRVDAINRTGGRPLEAVRAEISAQLGGEKRQQALADLVTRIEDQLGDGATMEEVAQKEGLQLKETPPITATGAQIENAAFRLPEIQPLLKTGFEMSADEEPAVETLPEQRYAILGVGRIVPAAAPPLAQIAQRVKADLVVRRASDRAKALATAISAKINRGVPAARAFAEAGVRLPAPQSVSARRIDISRGGQQVPPPLQMLFSLPRGKSRILAAPAGQGWFVVHHATSVPGDAKTSPVLVQATTSQFQRFLGEEYAAQFTNAAEAAGKVERNAEAIRRLKQQLLSGGRAQQ